MDRLKRTVLNTAAHATPLQDVAPSPLQGIAGAPTLPVHPHIGALGISNSALGDGLNGALPICLTTMGDQALMNECGQVLITCPAASCPSYSQGCMLVTDACKCLGSACYCVTMDQA